MSDQLRIHIVPYTLHNVSDRTAHTNSTDCGTGRKQNQFKILYSILSYKKGSVVVGFFLLVDFLCLTTFLMLRIAYTHSREYVCLTPYTM